MSFQLQYTLAYLKNIFVCLLRERRKGLLLLLLVFKYQMISQLSPYQSVSILFSHPLENSYMISFGHFHFQFFLREHLIQAVCCQQYLYQRLAALEVCLIHYCNHQASHKF